MEPSKSNHLFTHSNGFENHFRSVENYRYFLIRYEHFIPSVADKLAYCLMPNHLHLLVYAKDEEEFLAYFKTNNPTNDLIGLVGKSKEYLSGLGNLVILQFSNLFNAYTKAFNKLFQRIGSLFTRSFRRKKITNNTYFTKVIQYIHPNPIHHSYVKNFHEWKWNSFSEILQEEPSVVKSEEIINWSGTKEAYQSFHQRHIDVRTQIEMET